MSALLMTRHVIIAHQSAKSASTAGIWEHRCRSSEQQQTEGTGLGKCSMPSSCILHIHRLHQGALHRHHSRDHGAPDSSSSDLWETRALAAYICIAGGARRQQMQWLIVSRAGLLRMSCFKRFFCQG